MRAVRIEQLGIDKVQVRELPDPVPVVREVLVATEAATINPADAAVASGAAAPRFPFGASGPYIPGSDLVGTIRVFGLDEVRAAYQAIATRTGRGRVVLRFLAS